MRLFLSGFALILTVVFSDLASAQINYDESVSGDLSTPQAPSDLGAAGAGVNTVTGLLFNTNDFDPDAFFFTVGAGLQLDSLMFTSLDGSGNHFFAFNDGPLSTGSGAGNLISTLINTADIGLDILDGTDNIFGGSGLNGDPLGPGTYYVWFQENGGTDHNYTIEFTLSQSIPEPASTTLFLLAGAFGLGLRRKNRRA